ncbi:hypothetical protein E2C01_062086 [Portunus trituberculatus]|uniref:Uncharacterized protein n=1 Tax=Portunus trituberculatus TaxID=210409 RepID=A0A5B7H705_PORTR|nr:hypothetical protein [Portunus trituberculatus]
MTVGRGRGEEDLEGMEVFAEKRGVGGSVAGRGCNGDEGRVWARRGVSEVVRGIGKILGVRREWAVGHHGGGLEAERGGEGRGTAPATADRRSKIYAPVNKAKQRLNDHGKLTYGTPQPSSLLAPHRNPPPRLQFYGDCRLVVGCVGDTSRFPGRELVGVNGTVCAGHLGLSGSRRCFPPSIFRAATGKKIIIILFFCDVNWIREVV